MPSSVVLWNFTQTNIRIMLDESYAMEKPREPAVYKIVQEWNAVVQRLISMLHVIKHGYITWTSIRISTNLSPAERDRAHWFWQWKVPLPPPDIEPRWSQLCSFRCISRFYVKAKQIWPFLSKYIINCMASISFQAPSNKPRLVSLCCRARDQTDTRVMK